MDDLIKIQFKELEGKFIKFFDLEDNKQILFSGPFGSGKTTFLKDFAALKASEYEFIHIFPVNYSLHNNIDIYEILKYDIILELIGKGVFGAPEVSSLMGYIFATSQTLDNGLANLLAGFSKTGRQLRDLIDLLKKNKGSFTKKIQDIKDPLLSIKSFENLINEIKGYEYDDYITSLIREKLVDLSKNKKVVLIVDDLDRIDPEHLLRIISVFSAHIDYNTGDNKFGFNKIIFVGDIDSFKGMFAHRFGTSETFNGYITKLCSKQPFKFDPAHELYTKIISILSHYEASYKESKHSFYPFEQKTKIFKELIVYLFANLIQSKIISLRDLINHKTERISIDHSGYFHKFEMNYFDNDLYVVYQYLNSFIKNDLYIIQALEKIEQSPIPLNRVLPDIRNYSHIFSNFSSIPLNSLSHNQIFKNRKEGEEFAYEHSGDAYVIVPYINVMERRMSFRLSDGDANTENFLKILKTGLIDLIRIID